jgi:FAD/FMN-containing dehydrogenase
MRLRHNYKISLKSRHFCTFLSSHLNNFKNILDEKLVLSNFADNDSNIEKYRNDWLKSYSGGSVVCLPKSTVQIQNLLKYCDQNKIKVVPQGGNTGLVGGSVARNDSELILSLEKLNKIIDFDEISSVLICESGCVLSDLENFANKQGYIVPLDLGSKGSCMIGGCVSTNAGGLRVLRYGSLHHNILGLEIVLPNGDKLDLLKKLRKDNSGYPLRHLFIGSEGTLGVITKVAIQLVPKPLSVQVLLLKVRISMVRLMYRIFYFNTLGCFFC